MFIKAYQIMFTSAILLIILGIYGFIIPKGSPTSLISSAVGLVLFILAFSVKKDNHITAHIGIGLTLLSAIVFYITGFIRGNSIIIVMASVCLASVIFYIFDFIARKRQRTQASV
jgi:hypothetical protein